MVKARKLKKKKGIFRYENYFGAYKDADLRTSKKDIPKEALYRWAKKRVKYFKKDQRRTRRKYSGILKRRVPLKDNFFLIYFKTHILICIYVAIPLTILLVAFNLIFLEKDTGVLNLLEHWNRVVRPYGFGLVVTYENFIVFMIYYFSFVVFTLKILFFPPLFISHLFIIWYVHLHTKWNDYMERKLISIAVWRLGVGYLPASAEIINSWIFWGERYYIDFYKNVLITGPFFVIKQIWKFFGTIFSTLFKTIFIFIFNIFK